MLREETSSLRSLFDELIDLAPERHEAFFAQRGVDGDLKRRLQRMWASRAEPGSGLPDDAPLELAEILGDEEPPTLMTPGARIGSFELLDVIGEGGSATVFRAARTLDGVRQVVALKLLHRGMQTADAQRLFRRERLALSQLEHPGIARFIEGGVAENGVAYIALDFVDGRPITDDVRVRNLDEIGRLRDRIGSMVRNRLGGGYGNGGQKWEVSTQVTLEKD